MNDPGRPFTRNFATVVADLEDRLRNGVEQQTTAPSFVFQPGTTSYELPANVESIVNVSGFVNRRAVTFTAGTDYRLAGTRLIWADGGRRPDDASPVSVDYLYREPASGLTDFNTGSVAGTLTRAFARELAFLYEQMNEAYRRAFIDTASGVALDNVVALVNVSRAAVAATGTVVFSRKTPPQQTVQIPAGTRVADSAGRTFVTTQDATIPPAAPLEELAHPVSAVVKTTNAIGELIGVWKSAVSEPGATNALTLKPGFGSDGQTIAIDPANQVVDTDELRIRYKPLFVEVGIQAENPGPGGNLAAKTITVMPTPPPGAEAVTNPNATIGGQDPESDELLRDRAKHELERAGKSTLDAIKYAVLAVPGVSGVDVIDHSVDSSIPLGTVRVRYATDVSDPTTLGAIRDAIEKTRAAGVDAVDEAVSRIVIRGTFVMIPAAASLPPAAADAFKKQVADTVDALPIGAALGVRKLNALAYGIQGVADVAEAQLTRPDPADASKRVAVTDPLLVAGNEIVRLDPAQLNVVVLSGFAVPTPPSPASGLVDRTVTVQLLDDKRTAVPFLNYAIDVDVAISASSKVSRTDPLTLLEKSRKTLVFTGQTAQLMLTKNDDFKNFDASKQETLLTIVITAPAYPALLPATTSVDWKP